VAKNIAEETDRISAGFGGKPVAAVRGDVVYYSNGQRLNPDAAAMVDACLAGNSTAAKTHVAAAKRAST
jgi:hypothetical protein